MGRALPQYKVENQRSSAISKLMLPLSPGKVTVNGAEHQYKTEKPLVKYKTNVAAAVVPHEVR